MKDNREEIPAREKTFVRNQVPTELFKGQEKTHPAVLTISLPREEIFLFLRDFANHAKFMSGVRSVLATSKKLYHFAGEDNLTGKKIEWDIEIVAERPNEMIAWQTVGDGAFRQIGALTFENAVGNRGTVITLKVAYQNSVGQVTGALAKLIGKDPKTQAGVNLRRLKAFLETGEVPTIEGQPNGKDKEEQH